MYGPTIPCESCGGKGTQEYYNDEVCHDCDGFGDVPTLVTCWNCEAAGQIVVGCPVCRVA